MLYTLLIKREVIKREVIKREVGVIQVEGTVRPKVELAPAGMSNLTFHTPLFRLEIAD